MCGDHGETIYPGLPHLCFLQNPFVPDPRLTCNMIVILCLLFIIIRLNVTICVRQSSVNFHILHSSGETHCHVLLSQRLRLDWLRTHCSKDETRGQRWGRFYVMLCTLVSSLSLTTMIKQVVCWVQCPTNLYLSAKFIFFLQMTKFPSHKFLL